jgi:hypothetical protein
VYSAFKRAFISGDRLLGLLLLGRAAGGCVPDQGRKESGCGTVCFAGRGHTEGVDMHVAQPARLEAHCMHGPPRETQAAKQLGRPIAVALIEA